MKFSFALTFVGFVATVSALPIPLRRRQLEELQQPTISDVDILQFALTLENLEASFYLQGLSKFSEADFRRENVPNPTQTFQNFHHILQHELAHVKTLQTVILSLGGTPVPACEYQFPFQTVPQFMAVANSLEKVGVSAYNGALALIQNPDLQTAAATIDTVEARHASFLQTANGGDPFPENFDVALDGRQIITLASPFIKQCSFDLGFIPFGQLIIKNQINLPEGDVEVAFQQVTPGEQNFCNWLFAEQSVVVPLNGNLCEIPRGARGDVYLMITNDQTPVTLKKTNTIVAGPAIVTIDTAHSDSCKRLFSGQRVSEGKVNQPEDHGPIPFNDPSAYGTASLTDEYGATLGLPPSQVGAIPTTITLPPSDVGAIPTTSFLPPSDVGAIPTTTTLPPSGVDEIPSTIPTNVALSSLLPSIVGTIPSEDGELPLVDGAPTSSTGELPSQTILPGSNVVSASSTSLPGVPVVNTTIDVAAQDPVIQQMYAEIALLTANPSSEFPVEPSPTVDPVTGLPVESTVPAVDPATGLPVEPSPPVDPLPVESTVPEVDPVTGLPVEPSPPVDPATGLPVETPLPAVDPATGLPVDTTTPPA